MTQRSGNVWQRNRGAWCTNLNNALVTRRNLRALGFNQQALYCYGKVYGLDPSNLNALWDRAALAKEIGDNRTVGAFFTLG